MPNIGRIQRAIEALQGLRERLESLPSCSFDMTYWRDDCGTRGCAAGWFSILGTFEAESFFCGARGPVLHGKTDLTAPETLAELFEIPKGVASDIFMPSGPDEPLFGYRALDAVVAKLRSLLPTTDHQP